MALVLSRTTTDSQSTVRSLTASPLAIASDFAASAKLANETDMINITTPLGFEETVRFSVDTIQDVYKNTRIEKGYQLLTKRGVSILTQLNSTLKLGDTANADYIAALPISAHLVLKVPEHELVTDAVVFAQIMRLLGAMYENTGTTMNARISNLIRRVTAPAGV